MLKDMKDPDAAGKAPGVADARRSRNMLALSKAPMPELVAALEEERTLSDEGVGLPRRSKRVARFLMSEAIRLIRLGTRAEVADAALELVEVRQRSSGKRLAEEHPPAFRLLTSAADALAAATPPSSGGGELTVLRSWNGKAREAVALVNRRSAIPRAELRAELDVSESYLSHLLADLEAAGLVVRIKTGNAVMVHLGRVARSEHVQELMPHDPSRKVRRTRGEAPPVSPTASAQGPVPRDDYVMFSEEVDKIRVSAFTKFSVVGKGFLEIRGDSPTSQESYNKISSNRHRPPSWFRDLDPVLTDN